MPCDSIQTGCFSRLLSFSRRHAPQSGSISSPGSKSDAGAPSALDAVSSAQQLSLSGSELPPYLSTCYCEHDCHAAPSQTYPEKPPSYVGEEIFRPEVVATIEATLTQLDPELRALSLDIWNHPEIGYDEHHTHDVLTTFMAKHGFAVTPHYLGLPTAWRASFAHRAAATTRVIGVNAEMDALPGIGHACGHNLIAASAAGVALALRAALVAHDVPGTIVVLGTPAEEGGGGKIELLERGAYEEMDVCVMSHPSPGRHNSVSLGPSLACQHMQIEFFGHPAHAASAPWEGQNALDAAFLAYGAVSVLRQQLKPTHRVHGIVSGRDWAPNVIPDYAKMTWIVRAPSAAELDVLRERVRKCFEAAAHATACTMTSSESPAYYDLRQNHVLGAEFAHVLSERQGYITAFDSGSSASTDFGNVTYALPALHPAYAIPTVPNGGNHTAQFADAAAAPAAHAAMLVVAGGLAAAAFRVLDDAAFYAKVREGTVGVGTLT